MPSDPLPIAPAPAPIRIGDRVSWNGQYQGRVVAVNGETAVVHEPANFALGRGITWRLRLDALTRIETPTRIEIDAV